MLGFLTGKLNIILVVVILISIATYTGYWFKKGYSTGELKVINAQIDVEKKVRKKHAKVDKQTPFNADKRKSLDWLYQYGRSDTSND